MSLSKDFLDPVIEERRQEYLRQAALERLAARATQAPIFQAKLLAWLGDRLVNWGYRLQERYCEPCTALANIIQVNELNSERPLSP